MARGTAGWSWHNSSDALGLCASVYSKAAQQRNMLHLPRTQGTTLLSHGEDVTVMPTHCTDVQQGNILHLSPRHQPAAAWHVMSCACRWSCNHNLAPPEVHHAHAPLHDCLTAGCKQTLAQVREHGGSNGSLQGTMQQHGNISQVSQASYPTKATQVRRLVRSCLSCG